MKSKFIRKEKYIGDNNKFPGKSSFVLVFSGENKVSLSDQALSLISDSEAMKQFVKENGCIHCLPRHIKRKYSDKTSLFIFKDGSSLLVDPKSKHGAFSRNEEETLDFLKVKPSKNEMFFRILKIKKERRNSAFKNVRHDPYSSIKY